MSTLNVEHNLEPEELCKVLVGIAKSSHIESDVVEALSKAIDKDQVSEPRDPYIRELHRNMHALFDEASDWARNFVDEYLKKGTKRTFFAKATSGYLDRPLSKQEVREIQFAIKERFGYIAAQMDSDYDIDKSTLDLWKKLGIIDKKVTAQDFAVMTSGSKYIRNAFLWGRFQLAVEKGGTDYHDILKLALDSPLTKVDKYAVAVAEGQAAQYITSFGENIATRAGQQLMEKNRSIVKNMVSGVHRKELEAIKLREGAPTQIVEDWQGLSSELYHTMQDKTRDWDRIAFYELNDSKRYGKAMGLLKKYGAEQWVYKTPRATACPQCLELYLEADGSPRLFRVGDMMTHGSNVGRKPMPTRGGKVVSTIRKDKKEVLQPVAGLVHPYCQCDGPDVFTGHEEWADKREDYL